MMMNDQQQKPGAPQLPPEEIEARKRITAAAMKVLYSDPGVTKKVLEIVRSAEDPAQGIADAVKVVLEPLRPQIQGKEPDVIDEVAPVIAMLIAELAVKAGLIEDDAKLMQQVFAILKGEQAAPQEQDMGMGEGQPRGMVEQAMGDGMEMGGMK